MLLSAYLSSQGWFEIIISYFLANVNLMNHVEMLDTYFFSLFAIKQ